MIGNVSFAVAEKHAETYKYYERNKNAALFTYNILIYGSREAATNLSSRVYNHINGEEPGFSFNKIYQFIC